jgi:acyl carrier protein
MLNRYSEERFGMQESDVRRNIKQIIIKELDLRGKTEADIADDLPLFGAGGLGLDSLDALQLATALEEQYAVSVPDDKESKGIFRSVETLAAFVMASVKDA